jgi:hypothetical protein
MTNKSTDNTANNTLLRHWVMDFSHWTGYEEGYSGSNYNHHWSEFRSLDEDEIKDILVAAYKGELDVEFDGERLEIHTAETSRHREGIFCDLLNYDAYANDELEFDVDDTINSLFDKSERAPSVDFLIAMNA